MKHTHNVPMIDSDLEHAKDHLIGLVEDIYRTGSIEDMEFHLEEILGVFDLKIPRTEPLLYSKPKTEKIDQILSEWVDFSHSYARSLCNQ